MSSPHSNVRFVGSTRFYQVLTFVLGVALVVSAFFVCFPTFQPSVAGEFYDLGVSISPEGSVKLGVGVSQNFSATVTGGQYPYTFTWTSQVHYQNGTVGEILLLKEDVVTQWWIDKYFDPNQKPVSSWCFNGFPFAMEDYFVVMVNVVDGVGGSQGVMTYVFDPYTSPTQYLNGANSATYSYKIETDGLGWYRAINGSDGSIIDAWSSTNRTAVEQLVVTALTATGGTVVLNQVQWNQSITIPVGVQITEYYGGKTTEYRYLPTIDEALTRDEIFVVLNNLATTYPNLINSSVIGQSVGENDITMYRVGNGDTKVMITTWIHGTEYNGVYSSLLTIKWLLEGSAEANYILANTQLLFVPALNYDNAGVAQTNPNNVNINRNFANGWSGGVDAGVSPLSEPEAQALQNALETEQPDIFLDLHSGAYAGNDGTIAPLANIDSETYENSLKLFKLYQTIVPSFTTLGTYNFIGNPTNPDAGVETYLPYGRSRDAAAELGAVALTFEISDIWEIGTIEKDETGFSECYTMHQYHMRAFLLACTHFISSEAETIDLLSGLTLHLNLDEEEGSTASDNSPYGNTATLVHEPFRTTGAIGNCLNFSGSLNQYLSIPTDESLNLGAYNSSFAVSFWMNLASGPTEGQSFILFQKNDGSTDNRGYQIVLRNESSDIRFRIVYSSNGLTYGTTVTISPHYLNMTDLIGQWMHVVFVVINDYTHCYFNGVSQGREILLTPLNLYSENQATLYIGSDGGVNNCFDGKLDDIRFYNGRILNNAEAQALFSLGAEATAYSVNLQSGLALHLELDEEDGSTAVDSSLNGNTATLNNSPEHITGVMDNALNFSRASKQYLSLADDSALRLGANNSSFSVSFWINMASAPNSTQGYYLFCKNDGSSNNRGYQIFLGNISDNVRFRFRWSSDGLTYNTDIPISPYLNMTVFLDQWVYVAIIVTDGYIQCYFNGMPQEQTVLSNPLNIFDTQAPLYISGDGGVNNCFDGKLDDIRFYNRELNVAEVTALYWLGL